VKVIDLMIEVAQAGGSVAEIMDVYYGDRLVEKPKHPKDVPVYRRPQKCKYCSRPATKSVLWAEHRAYIPVCGSHLATAKKGREVDKVYDIEQG
jgi:hypothetical protein